jgi:enoyl-CoA hydratase
MPKNETGVEPVGRANARNPVLYDVRGSAAWVTLNRLEKLNALDHASIIALERCVRLAEDDRAVRIMVITGSGRAFCVGADLAALRAALLAGAAERDRFLDRLHAVLGSIRNFPKPVIAAINGTAVAGGLELALCCDILIACESAKLGDAHINFSLVPGCGGSSILPRRIGLNRAKMLLFTGELLPASTFREWGLVNEVVPDDRLSAAVMNLVGRIEGNSQAALAELKLGVQCSLDHSIEEALRREARTLRTHLGSSDARAGWIVSDANTDGARRPTQKGNLLIVHHVDSLRPPLRASRIARGM